MSPIKTIYHWCTSTRKPSNRELIVELLRGTVPMADHPVMPRISVIQVKNIVDRYQMLHAMNKSASEDADHYNELTYLALWMDHIWTFIHTWTFLEMPGSEQMKDKTFQLEEIHYDISSVDFMLTFVYSNKEVNVCVYLDYSWLHRTVSSKLADSPYDTRVLRKAI